MSNVDKLAAAGLLDPGRVSDEQQGIINNDLSDAEVDALISSHQKLGGEGSMHSGDDPGASVF
jgi:hypothetical protein